MTQHRWHDQPPSALYRMLSDEAHLGVLMSGKKEHGGEKTALVQGLVSEIGDDVPGQEDMLKAIIETLAKEGSSEDTNKRDAALAILANEALASMLKTHIRLVYHAYLDAIHNLTNASDPYGGSIYALLEAGKTLAHFFKKGSGQSPSVIVSAWQHIAALFITDTEKRLHILSESDKIFEIIQPGDVEQQGGKRESTQRFDDQVEPLINQGLAYNKIVEQLSVEEQQKPPSMRRNSTQLLTAVHSSAKRLRKQGKIQQRKGGMPRGKRETTQRFDDQVEKLIKEGLDNNEIVERLSVAEEQKPPNMRRRDRIDLLAALNISVQRLLEEGKIPQRKGGMPSGKREVTQRFDDQVEQLIKEGLDNNEIVERLSVAEEQKPPSMRRRDRIDLLSAFNTSVLRLRKEGKIPYRKPRRKPKN